MNFIIGYVFQRQVGTHSICDGQPLSGYFLSVEQPNRTFLKRNPDGNLYKILWHGNDIVDQHEKKTNRHEAHEDGDCRDQWRFIQQHFNVPESIDYFTVNM